MVVHLVKQTQIQYLSVPECGRYSPKSQPELTLNLEHVTCELCKVTKRGQKLFGKKHHDTRPELRK